MGVRGLGGVAAITVGDGDLIGDWWLGMGKGLDSQVCLGVRGLSRFSGSSRDER